MPDLSAPPTRLAIDTVCDGASASHNEDLVAVFEHAGVTDILVLDGGTSVAATNHVDDVDGDVVWFVRQFCRLLAPHLRSDRAQADSVARALADVHAAFLDLTGGRAVPPHAWPIAAMSWLRIVPAAGTGHPYRLHGWCVGDCKTLLLDGTGASRDLDPYINPQEAILQAELRRLAEAGVTAAARKAHLLPMLQARRAEQNLAAAPSILCLAPRGPLAARSFTVPLEAGSAVLGMTDGFYRLVDPYALLTQAELARRCVSDGVAPMLACLRAFEADRRRADSLAVKAADDAAAVLCRLVPRVPAP